MNIRISLPMVLVACAAVGFVGYFTGLKSQSVSGEAEDYKARLIQLQEKMQNFTDADFQEYQQLKDRAQQYAKAEELLGKIMMVFLADLGVKVNKSDLDKVAKMAEPLPQSSTPPVSTQAPPPPSAPPDSKSPIASVSKPAADSGQPVNWTEKEKGLSEINNEADAENFLKKIAVDNLFSVIKSARELDPRMLESLNGNFQGRVAMDDPQAKAMDITLELKGYRQGESSAGSYKIIMSTSGQPESSTSGSGGLKDFHSVEGSTQAVLIRTSPNSYVQIYPVPRMNQLIGIYYKQENVDKFSKMGTVSLTRR